MNELTLTNEKQAKALARQLSRETGVANVHLYRSRNGQHFRLTYDCRVTLHQDQLQARAERALQMVEQGYEVVWAGDNGLVLGPQGQVYAGNLDHCACADMQKRLAKSDESAYKGACKHGLYRAVDLLVRANRALHQRTTERRPAQMAAAAV